MVAGTVAPTDYGWYEFLSSQPGLQEANFWSPSARRAFHAPEFSPFLFKLKAPHNAICGFGYFSQYTALPDWLAWDCFGAANGCATLGDMRERIRRIRDRMGYDHATGSDSIGCVIVVGVALFAPEQWIPQPRDWPPRNLRPMRYDLSAGEGARVWNACLERTTVRTVDGASIGRDGGARYGEPTLVRPRLGQGAFRVAVTDAYGRACAVTGEHSLPVLEAAHIRAYADDGPHDVRNGLLLRADLHRLFDLGYVTVTPEFRIDVSPRLRSEYQNGRSYYPMHGAAIRVPQGMAHRPDPEFLRWHNEQVFRA